MAGHEIEKGEVNVQTPTERLHDDIRKNNEKDCTDQLLECTTECEPNDKECHDECIEEYHDCELPWEEDVQMTNEHDEGELISEILQIAALLGGTVERTQSLDSTGRSSNKIIIEYNVTNTTTTTD
tara:strand:+ start:130 stop:507 length:378 start_codon:yes stop_codon:yes gene_type:complete